MDDREKRLRDIRREGFRALVEHLGADGAIQFVQQFDTGSGDYTQERSQWLGMLTIEDIVEDIIQLQSRDSDRT